VARSHPQHGLHVASDAGISPHQTQRRRGAVASCRKVRTHINGRHLRPIHRHPALKHAAQARPNSPPDPSNARQKSIHFQALSRPSNRSLQRRRFLPGKGWAWAETGQGFSATTARSKPHRPRFPLRIRQSPGKVMTFPQAAGNRPRAGLRGGAGQDSNRQPSNQAIMSPKLIGRRRTLALNSVGRNAVPSIRHRLLKCRHGGIMRV
jgi:hypothetical protein